MRILFVTTTLVSLLAPEAYSVKLQEGGTHQNAPRINIIDNNRTMISGQNGGKGIDGKAFDVAGFAMSLSGIPGFNMQ